MNILNKMTYGQYIATTVKSHEEMSTREKDFIAAGTINWASQTSFNPPMIAMAVKVDSDLQETIEKSREFTLHILRSDQQAIAKDFGSDSRINDNTINGINYRLSEEGHIILEETLGHIDCHVEESISSGDHTLYLATVIYQEEDNEGDPLTTSNGGLRYTRKK